MGLPALFVCSVLLSSTLSQNVSEREFALSTISDSNTSEVTPEEVVVEDELDIEDQQVFYPTHQWQVVRPGQAVPAGLHIRFNLQTGTNEAKFPDTDAVAKEGIKRDKKLNLDPSLYTPQELKDALSKLKDDIIDEKAGEATRTKALKSRFRPIEQLKQEFEQLHMNIESDVQIMTRLIKTLNSTKSTLDEKSAALYDLEYYVHQVDNAQDLLPLGGLQIVIGGLNSTEPLLKERSAFVLGAALSSNPRVQVRALEGGALHKLLTMLATDQSPSVKKKALFALSSLLRQFPYAQQQFLKLGGLDVLKDLTMDRGAHALSVRVVTLLYDLMIEKLAALEAGNNSESDKLLQYSQVDLVQAVQDQGWCPLISTQLGVPEHDNREKVLKTLKVLLSSCQEVYRNDEQLSTALNILRKEYEELVAEEESEGDHEGYFKEILSTVVALIEGLR